MKGKTAEGVVMYMYVKLRSLPYVTPSGPTHPKAEVCCSTPISRLKHDFATALNGPLKSSDTTVDIHNGPRQSSDSIDIPK